MTIRTRFICAHRKLFQLIFVVLTLSFAVSHAAAELISSNTYGYAIDLPEAFRLEDKQSDGKAYLFAHTILPVQLAITTYDDGRYKNATEALSATFGKLNAKGDISKVNWRSSDCILSSFDMQLPGQANGYKGWAAAVTLPEKKAQLVLLCYAPEAKENDCEQFILSVLDSLMIDRGSFFENGLVTAFAYPGSKPKPVTLSIDGTEIKTQIDEEDSEAETFVIEREYAVLTLYAKNSKWKEAWQRYYRMIYRDSYKRLKRPAFDIYNILYQEAKKKDSKNPDAVITQQLLTWAQNFPYVQDSNTADFTPLSDTLTGKASDCDSRSLLLCTLLGNCGLKTALFVSQAYSHAVLGVALDIPGAKIQVGKTNFLLGETTAHVDIGRIAQDMSDTTKWIPVELY